MSDDSFLIVVCHCGQKMKVPKAAVGKVCKCVRCAARHRVTEDGLEPLQEQPAPQPPEPSGEEPQQDLGQLLLEKGLVTQEQLTEGRQLRSEQGGRLFRILIELDHLKKDAFHAFLQKQASTASINLKNYDIPNEVIALVPKDIAQRNMVLPIDKLGKLLTIGMACPLDTDTITELERITGLRVKAMLCGFDEIEAAIKRYYRVPGEDGGDMSFELPAERPRAKTVAQEAPPQEQAAPQAPPPPAPSPEPAAPPPPRDEVAAEIEELEALAPFSGTLKEIHTALQDASASVRAAAEVAATDPAVALKLLSVANFPAYGMPDSVTSVGLAAVLLGTEGVASVAESLQDAAPIDAAALLDLKGLRRRSIFCATAAMAIAGKSGRDFTGEAYTAGLLHAVGHLALASVRPGLYAEAAAPDAQGADQAEGQIQAQKKTLGLDYTEAGFLLLSRWKIPLEITEAVRYQHDPQRILSATPSADGDRTADLVAIVALSVLMAEVAESDPAQAVQVLGSQKPLLDLLGLDAAAAGAILEQTRASFEKQASGA